ncbi:MAG: nitroreductase [Pseudomonadota bacterium]
MPDPRPDVLDFLLTRRSHTAKTLTGPGPEGAALTPLITAAARVPDHGKLEPWRFVVIGTAALPRICDAALTRLSALGQDDASLEKSRVVFSHGATIVAVIASPKPSEKIPVWEQELSAGALCLGLVNAAHAAGWGANWLTGPLARDRAFLRDALGCADHEWAPGFIHIGTPQITPAERDRPDIEALTTWL